MPALLSLIVYLGCIFFGVYLIGSSIYLFVYRSFFANYINALNTSPKDWKKHFWGRDFEKMKSENWRLMNSIIIMGLVTVIFLGLLIWVSYSFMKNYL